jgi:hypothetical protein
VAQSARGLPHDSLGHQNRNVRTPGPLRVGNVTVSRLRDGFSNELCAVFRDDMLKIRRVTEYEYYFIEQNYEEEDAARDVEIEILEYRASGRAIAHRLDLMGVDAATVLNELSRSLSDKDSIMNDPEYLASFPEDLRTFYKKEEAYKASLDGNAWVKKLAVSDPASASPGHRNPGSREWLLDQLYGWDDRFALRAILLAFPDEEVVLNATDLLEDGHTTRAEVIRLPSDSIGAISGMAGMHAPVVVLTEGSTDAEFLQDGLAVLYPYLTDLIRFLDYQADRRPEGGVSALMRTVRAFAAAGIVNRVVAVFDNDAAAADVLRTIGSLKLPDQIQIIRYPDLELAKSYPTLGPPTADLPEGSISFANINGLAASIELYLGADVLTSSKNELHPVQWKSFLPGIGRYQGEVTNKELIHKAFRAKHKSISRDPSLLETQDWEGLRLILDAIRRAGSSAFGGGQNG